MSDIKSLFPHSYEASRQRFVNNLEIIQSRWPQASHNQHTLIIDPNLTIDWIAAPSQKKTKKLLIFTTGEHGIEGYVGSALLQRFIDTILDRLNPQDTHLLFLHIINPWGMKYSRRTNAENIDLNRTFFWPSEEPEKIINTDYSIMKNMIDPKYPVHRLYMNNLSFFLHFILLFIRLGKKRVFTSPSLGQYRYPQGIYFGGASMPEETKVVISLLRQAFQICEHIVHLDMHTGWGPRYQMTLIDSIYEPRPSKQIAREYEYPAVAAANANEFYSIKGDMIDWVYSLRDNEYPGTRLYSTTFEFGTFGQSLLSDIRSLRTMVFENQLYWHGATNQKIEELIKRDFKALFYPESDEWCRKAISDADQAFNGILSAEGFI